jgi:thiosulfate dehydrogenase (quinone) large subunit
MADPTFNSPRARSGRWDIWLPALRRDTLHANAYLLPVRWFIGIGWLRSAVEKLLDPAWHDGDVLLTFLATEGERGALAFPELGQFVQSVVEPSAPLVAGFVLALQLLCGAGILVGTFTNAALLIGIGMNLSFMAAGAPNPSAFYILIQLVLFLSNVGAIVGFDGRALARRRSLLIAARAQQSDVDRADRWSLGVLCCVFAVISSFAFAHGTDFSPAGSVTDPAVVMGLVTALAALMVLLVALRPATTVLVDLTERLARLEDRQRQHSHS